MYLTSKKIVFYSWFNNNTLFGRTLLEIPKGDIIKVEKRSNRIFDNMLSIKTELNEFFFTTFINREETYNIIVEKLIAKKYGMLFVLM